MWLLGVAVAVPVLVVVVVVVAVPVPAVVVVVVAVPVPVVVVGGGGGGLRACLIICPSPGLTPLAPLNHSNNLKVFSKSNTRKAADMTRVDTCG